MEESSRQVSVLVVDDFEDGRELYREYLTFKGFRVLTASTGSEAIEIARQHRPDVILLDIRLPDVPGTEVVKTLRASPECRRTPIVALTAHALTEEQRAARDAGFDEVLVKPCPPDTVVQTVERLVAGQRLRPRRH